MATLERIWREHADFAGSFLRVSLISIVVSMSASDATETAGASFMQTLFLVFLGGALGALLRALMMFGVQGEDAEPLLLLAINTAGSFALGALMGWLGSRPRASNTPKIRALVGTGLIGGFTSYSSLALLTVQIGASQFWLAAGYALVTLILGIAAAWIGLRIGPAGAMRNTSERAQ